jgi:hypothetical protein
LAALPEIARRDRLQIQSIFKTRKVATGSLGKCDQISRAFSGEVATAFP